MWPELEESSRTLFAELLEQGLQIQNSMDSVYEGKGLKEREGPLRGFWLHLQEPHNSSLQDKLRACCICHVGGYCHANDRSVKNLPF